jgi:hypothetical protein
MPLLTSWHVGKNPKTWIARSQTWIAKLSIRYLWWIPRFGIVQIKAKGFWGHIFVCNWMGNSLAAHPLCCVNCHRWAHYGETGSTPNIIIIIMGAVASPFHCVNISDDQWLWDSNHNLLPWNIMNMMKSSKCYPVLLCLLTWTQKLIN